MFANTLVLPHSDGNITLVKINQDSYASEYAYRGATQQVTVKIRHTTVNAKAGRPAYDRHNVEVTQRIYATDLAAEKYRRTYIVIEQTPDDLDVKLTDSLADWLIATANSNVVSLLGWES